MRIKAAVIGCGVWGRNHARVYRDLEKVDLAAVVDADRAAAEGTAGKNGTKWYTDIDKVLEDPEIQMVSVCTPTITHMDIALRVIEAGKHVLVEKPMTNTPEEARILIQKAEKKGVKLTVGFVERFNPAVGEAIKRVNSSEIGDVILAHTRRVSRSPGRIGDVGVIKDLAIHDVDIINHLFKDQPETVFAVAGRLQHNYEDYANINVTYPHNRNAFIETNWLTPRRKRSLVITGSEGIISVEYQTQEITIEKNDFTMQPNLPYVEPLRLELDSFSRKILSDEEPEVTGEDGYKSLLICQTALQSAEEERAISLKK